MYELFPRLQERARQRAGTLSGGEGQMLAIARALMSRPSFLMLDEPSLGIMPRLVETIMEVLRRLHRQEGMTILLVEQNVPLTLEVSRRVYIMEKGVVRHQALAADLRADQAVIHQYLGV